MGEKKKTIHKLYSDETIEQAKCAEKLGFDTVRRLGNTNGRNRTTIRLETVRPYHRAELPPEFFSEVEVGETISLSYISASKELASQTNLIFCDLMLGKDEKNYGDLFGWGKFYDMVKDGFFTDYDGSGDFIVDGCMVKNCEVSCRNQNMVIFLISPANFGHFQKIPFEEVEKIFEGHELQIRWFNK